MYGVAKGKDKKTYPQDWRAYNAAQTNEKAEFQALLHTLCAGVEEPAKQLKGRPRLLLSDAVFAVCFKIFSTVSGRRFMADLKDAKAKGYITKTPHFNSIFNYLENPRLTPILYQLIEQTCLPLTAVETDFAVDSSGFTTSCYMRWREHKYGEKKLRQWVKVHLMCGVKTNVVTAVRIEGMHDHDSRMLPSLAAMTGKNFRMLHVSGDKAYSSAANLTALALQGAEPFIPFKKSNGASGGKFPIWDRMFHYFHFRQQEFMAHYHKRSNVETTFSMIKAKFGGYVRSKTNKAMVNECLCKIICHNICCLIQESHELKIGVNFWLPAQKDGPFS